jgi:D-alanine--poly(phosphoribitol) ligase subunit 1
MTLFDHYYLTFRKQGNRTAFADENRSCSYSEFLQMVSGARNLMESLSDLNSRNPVAVLCHNNVESYASIFAIWFSGRPYIPLNPSNPVKWNLGILQKLHAELLFDSHPGSLGQEYANLKIVDNSLLSKTTVDPPVRMEPGDYVYILTTSGTTGEPRNVPISLQNLEAFIRGFNSLFPAIDETDRFLQTYDLTADAAFTAFLVPLYFGATVVLTPDHPFRYLSVAKTLMNENISWVQVTPSLLSCLRPYFALLQLEKIKYFHIGGEALSEDLVTEFRPSIPNAEIANVYGPTETTVTALIYKCPAGGTLKSHQGSVSIGKPIGDVDILILGEDGELITGEGEGELLIGGSQVMHGYLKDKPGGTFYYSKGHNSTGRYYRTGDKVRRDGDGYCYFLGRLNNQVKISGYRVDLTEVETALATLCGKKDFVAVAPEITPGNKRLIVFTTDHHVTEQEMKKRIRENYPAYLVPERIIPIESIPLNLSGKTDRKKLGQIYLDSLNNE